MQWLIILILSLIILILSLVILVYIKKVPYITEKEKEFLEFTISMYIEYAEQLEINSKEQHTLIVNELEKIRKKFITKT